MATTVGDGMNALNGFLRHVSTARSLLRVDPVQGHARCDEPERAPLDVESKRYVWVVVRLARTEQMSSNLSERTTATR